MTIIPKTCLDVALEYAVLDYTVLPLDGKLPCTKLVPHAKDDASSSPAVIKQWWQQANTANVGVVPPASVLVLDLDEPKMLPTLFIEHPSLYTAPRARTGSGGFHVWLRLPEGVLLSSTVKRLPGVDLRGIGKTYLVCPPSLHPDTRNPYVWEIPLVKPQDLPLIPSALLERLLPPQPNLKPQPIVLEPMDSSRLEGLVHWAARQVAQAPQGTRHNTLLNHARLVGGWVGAGMDEGRAHDLLVHAALEAGLSSREAEATTRDGLRHGQAAPLPFPSSQEGGFAAIPSARNQRPSWTNESDLWQTGNHRWAECSAWGIKGEW